MFIKPAIIYLIAISGILVPLCHATNEDIIYEYYESLTACIKPENYNNVNDLIDEWLEFFTDDMEFCEGETESDATCYDKSGLKVEMLESIDNIHKQHAPESVQYAYIIENEYGDDINTKYELMLSSKHCIITLKESHKFTFEGDKIKKVFSYDMEDEEDCSPTTTKTKSGNSYDSDEDICSLPKLTGGCEGNYDRWYYNGKECEEFTYSGCEGNDNNFESLAGCELECDSKTKKPETTEPKEYIIEATTKEPTKKKTWEKDTESPTKSPSAKWTTPSPTYKPTNKPTYKPTDKPTPWPTKKPTDKPSDWPTKAPTYKPTEKPTNQPTYPPTYKPTMWPTNKPTYKPTEKPTKSPTVKPTYKPTYKPTKSPTDKPTTAKPTKSPTEKPTKSPTEKPTKSPITDKPTKAPTNKPTEKPTKWPTASPTQKPTYSPTKKPTTKAPTKWPTAKPTAKPTYAPTDKPTTPKPTGWPTQKPTTPKPTTAKPTIWEKKTEEPTVWKKETKEPTVWAKKTNKPTPSPTLNDEYKVEETKY